MSDDSKTNTATKSPSEDTEPRGPRQETYYDVLKVPANASVPEIIAAYHQAKAAFSQGSIATYSLFSDEEAQVMLRQLEEAYLTLTNIEKRRAYDTRIGKGLIVVDDTPAFSELDLRKKARDATAAKEAAPEKAGIKTSQAVETLAVVDGEQLKKRRERLGIGVDEAARITKIPGRYIRAIEAEEFKVLPARVYLQGFLTNLANLYRLEARSTTQGYLEHMDKQRPKKQI